MARRRFLLEDGKLVEEEEGGKAAADKGKAAGADRPPDAEGAAW